MEKNHFTNTNALAAIIARVNWTVDDDTKYIRIIHSIQYMLKRTLNTMKQKRIQMNYDFFSYFFFFFAIHSLPLALLPSHSTLCLVALDIGNQPLYRSVVIRAYVLWILSGFKNKIHWGKLRFIFFPSTFVTYFFSSSTSSSFVLVVRMVLFIWPAYAVWQRSTFQYIAN